MKKTLVAVYSISITAGTLYLMYSQFKNHLIKKLVKLWDQEAKKQKKNFKEEQVKQLKEELNKLYLWEVKQLSSYSEKTIQGAPLKETTPMLEKLKEKKIFEKANLKQVETILGW